MNDKSFCVNYSDTKKGDFIPHRLFGISKPRHLLCKWVRISIPSMSNRNSRAHLWIPRGCILACFFSSLKAFWKSFTSLEAGKGTQDSNKGNCKILQPRGSREVKCVCLGETEGGRGGGKEGEHGGRGVRKRERKERIAEKRPKKKSTEKETQGAQEGSNSLCCSGAWLEPGYQNGQELINLSHSSSEKCWGQPQSQRTETA